MAGADPKRARVGGGSTRDRLSALPDDLLHRIISFLPAQQVVRTTVLSKRWKDLWLYATGINLDFFDFRRASDIGWIKDWGRMEDFVNNLLMLHRAPCLDAFRLFVFFEEDDRRRRHFDRWVRRAIKDNPLVLEVSVCNCCASASYQFPHLGSSLCRLTRLHLSGFSLDHSFADERLHSWCPELKDLSLIDCRIAFCGIESDRLENLDLSGCTNPSADVFAIRAPRLASLSVDLPIPFSLDTGNSLLRSSISLEPSQFSPRSKARLLVSLSGTASFELKGYQTMAGLDEVFDKIPIFHKLRTFSLQSSFIYPPNSDIREFKALGRFLQKSPNLEKLTLTSFEVGPVVEPGIFPVLKNMTTLILDFCVLHANFQMLLQFLRNSPNLEKLIIQRCKVSNDAPGEKGKAKSKKTFSVTKAGKCLKLKCIEIIDFQDHAGVPELVRVLLDIAGPNITITYTNM